jgi:hypothetical protein
MKTKKIKNDLGRCHDCNCLEGEFHQPGCDMERCPFCGGQLISCDCSYKFLYPNDFVPSEYSSKYPYVIEKKPYNGLPEEVYEHGLPDDKAELWEKELQKKGLIPYIRYPNLCARCGKIFPEMFSVSDEEWKKYIEPAKRDSMICRECYDWIRKAVDDAEMRENNAPNA